MMENKIQISSTDGILSFPGFPVVLVGIKTNILTVAATSFFSFNNPPMVMIGIVPSRYSYELIMETMNYSINIPTYKMLKEISFCGSRSGRDIDKFSYPTLTPIKPKYISSYLIKECPVNLECKVVHILNLKGTHVWFVGEVIAAYREKSYNRSQGMFYWPREYRRVGEIITS